MKNWDYYTPAPPAYGYHEETAYIAALRAEIHNTPMTTAEREAALAEVKNTAAKHKLEQLAPYQQERQHLIAEFWRDACDELGYDEFLTPEGVAILQSKAWEDGHSSGFSEVFWHLQDLTDFCRQIIKHTK